MFIDRLQCEIYLFIVFFTWISLLITEMKFDAYEPISSGFTIKHENCYQSYLFMKKFIDY